MHRPRHAPTWLAALAVLLHLFAMPLMGADMGKAGHCPMAEANQHASVHGTGHDSHAGHEQAPADQSTHHVGMPCCCAAGPSALAAIPASAPELHDPHRLQRSVLPLPLKLTLTPRYRWPSLNPRASPLV